MAKVEKASLPQNILMVGEHVEEDKNIYINQKAYKQIHRFAKKQTKIEAGGVLAGRVVEEFGKQNIIVDAFIEAKHTEATPTTLTFTHESWAGIHEQIDKRYKTKKIVGWIHTHPSFGIFLSEYDKFIQENFFNGDEQIAYVVDPIQNTEGFFFWINGRIEKCPGFFVFDKNETPIDIDDILNDNEKEEDEEGKKDEENRKPVALIVILILSILLNGFLAWRCLALRSMLEHREMYYQSVIQQCQNTVHEYQQMIQSQDDFEQDQQPEDNSTTETDINIEQ